MRLGAALATSPIVLGLAVIWRSARQRTVSSANPHLPKRRRPRSRAL